jgi:hypothetical protein
MRRAVRLKPPSPIHVRAAIRGFELIPIERLQAKAFGMRRSGCLRVVRFCSGRNDIVPLWGEGRL